MRTPGTLRNNTNPYSSIVASPFYLTDPSYRSEKVWASDFLGSCQLTQCRRNLTPTTGLFCANFSARRGPFEPCRSCWCDGCFGYSGDIDFPIRGIVDEDGNPIVRGDEGTRFLTGRAGDMYMVPFQCPLCHFRNLRGRNPMFLSGPDRKLLAFIERAILDSLWAREPSTV